MYIAGKGKALGYTCTRQQEVRHLDVDVHDRKKYHTVMYMYTTARSKAP